jgi:hypothetical protein
MLPVLISTLLEKAQTDVFGGEGDGFHNDQHKIPNIPHRVSLADTEDRELAMTANKISCILAILLRIKLNTVEDKTKKVKLDVRLPSKHRWTWDLRLLDWP